MENIQKREVTICVPTFFEPWRECQSNQVFQKVKFDDGSEKGSENEKSLN